MGRRVAMEPTPVTREHLDRLASRLAWSRVLPGLALLVVGVSQPFATVEGAGDDPDRSLSLVTVVDRRDTLDHGTAASTFATLLIIGVVVLGVWTLSAASNRTDRSRQVTIALALLVLVLGLLAVVAIGSTETLSDEATVSLTAQGPVPLLLGAAAVWVAASRAKNPGRLSDRPSPEWPAMP